MSILALQRVTPDYFAVLNEISCAHDLLFDAHILETRLQSVFAQEWLGAIPAALSG